MFWMPAAALFALLPVAAQARVYLTVEQAQHEMFGAAALTPFPVRLTPAQQDSIRAASSVALPFAGERVWKAADGGWLVIDEVVGKHEFITYAVAIAADGRVRRVEVLEYRESYGHEVARRPWLAQFEGKAADAPLKLGSDVQNVAGATLSCKHLADGVKRVLAMHALLLRAR